MTVAAVEVDELTRRFGDRTVVDAVSFQVPTGAVTGFIGPNGAGKTTTLRILLGLIAPTDGDARIFGTSCRHPARALAQVGALVEGPTAYGWLSARDNLKILATLLDLPDRDARIATVLKQVGLADRAANKVSSYSLGMKQRLGIAAALLRRPRLIILDEPANGLDPQGIQETRRLLRSFADDGMAVLVSSHLLAELEQICDHLVLLDRGQVQYAGTLAGLTGNRPPTLRLAPADPADVPRLAVTFAAHGWPVTSGDRWVAVTARSADGATLNELAFAEGVVLSEISHRTETLEEAFLDRTSTIGESR